MEQGWVRCPVRQNKTLRARRLDAEPITRPSSGKCIAKSKGVHCEVESEESWRQSSGLTNRNHIRLGG